MISRIISKICKKKVQEAHGGKKKKGAKVYKSKQKPTKLRAISLSLSILF